MDRSRITDLRRDFLAGLGVPKAEPFNPDPFQLEAIEALQNGEDTLVIAPTGAGKTYVALEAMRTTVERGERAVYTAPLKALSNAKYAECKRTFEPTHSVGLLTGDRKIDGDASIVIATTEIYRNELYRSADNYSLVILDELHYLADPQRGAVWEESIILSPRTARLLMLSASISNPYEIADWIHEVRGKKVHVITVEKRPVPLRFGFIHPERGVVPLEDRDGHVLNEVTRFYSDEREGQGKFRFRKGGGHRKKSW